MEKNTIIVTAVENLNRNAQIKANWKHFPVFTERTVC